MSDVKENIIEILIAITLIALIVGMVVGMKSCAGADDQKNWNDGHCIKCGGDYEFTSATSVYGWGDEYYYTCTDCGYTIKTQNLMR